MTQPTSLFLADILEDAGKPADIAEKCATELRRLVTENLLLRQRHCDDNVEYTRVLAQRDALLSLLGSIRGWDVLDATADGAYWKREIDSAIKAVEEGK